MKKCEWCGKDHNKNGKTCCRSCATSFTNVKRKGKYHLSIKVRAKLSKIGTLEKIKIIKVCPRCNKKFEVQRNVSKKGNEIIHKKEKIYCSRTCANKRKQTEETKLKIGLKLKKPKIKYTYTCIICGNNFNSYKKTRKCCSKKCTGKMGSNITKNKYSSEFWSNKQKELYKNGIQKVGGGTSKWLQYKNIKVQGTYELRVCKILDLWKEKKFIKDWEYTNDRYEYVGVDNKLHTYILDFKVFNHNESFYYIEAKGYKRENDELKWRSVRNLGYKLEVWFENDIKQHEK